MDFGNMIKDAFNYPLTNIRKFFLLAIPNLVISVILIFLAYIGYELDKFSVEQIDAMLTFNDAMLLAIFMFIALLILIFFYILYYGMELEVIRKSLTSDELPDFNLRRFFVGGLKYIIVILLYSIIMVMPFIIALGIFYLTVDTDLQIIGLILSAILLIVSIGLFIVLLLMSYVALGRLAETNSISEACNLSYIYELTTKIGKLNILGVIIVFAIILIIPIFVQTVIEDIHYVMTIISTGIIETYISIAMSRLIASIYKAKDDPAIYNQNFNTSQNIPWGQKPQDVQNQQNQNITYSEDNSIITNTEKPQENTTSLDFQNINKQNNNNPEDNIPHDKHQDDDNSDDKKI